MQGAITSLQNRPISEENAVSAPVMVKWALWPFSVASKAATNLDFPVLALPGPLSRLFSSAMGVSSDCYSMFSCLSHQGNELRNFFAHHKLRFQDTQLVTL